MIRVVFDIATMKFIVTNSIGRTVSPNGERYFRNGNNEIVGVQAGVNPPAWLMIEDDQDAADLIIGLIDAGVKVALPNDNSFDKGKLEAIEQHLADMRKIVFEDKA